MINKKIASEIGVGVTLLTAIVIGGIFWIQNKNSVISEQSSVIENEKIEQSKPAEKKVTMCTQEAKLCEDGKTYVGRSGENCDFAMCPVIDNSRANVFIRSDKDKTYVIFEKNGVEIIIDQGVVDYNKDHSNLAEVKEFSNAKLSNSGNYVTYEMTGWEWGQSYVWNTNLKKTVFTQNSAGSFFFDNDEEYFVSCAGNEFDGTFDGKIFKVSDFGTPIFDFVEYDKTASKNYVSVSCKIDDDVVSIYLNNDSIESIDKYKWPANKTIKYSLSQNRVVK